MDTYDPGDLMPKNVVDAFYDRLTRAFSKGANTKNPVIQSYIKNILTVNGGTLPKKIEHLLQQVDNVSLNEGKTK